MGIKFVAICRASSIRPPFVLGIELGVHDDQDLHSPQGTMPGPWPNHHAHAGADGNDMVVELHPGFGAAFQEVIGLGQGFVVMKFRVLGDVGDVNGAGEIGYFGESAAGRPARTGGPGQTCEVDDLETALFGLSGHPKCVWRERFSAGRGILNEGRLAGHDLPGVNFQIFVGSGNSVKVCAEFAQRTVRSRIRPSPSAPLVKLPATGTLE